jgi:hypothetical protein
MMIAASRVIGYTIPNCCFALREIMPDSTQAPHQLDIGFANRQWKSFSHVFGLAPYRNRRCRSEPDRLDIIIRGCVDAAIVG